MPGDHEGDAARGGETGQKTSAETVACTTLTELARSSRPERRNRLSTIESDERCADAGEVELVLCLPRPGNEDVVAALRQPGG